MVVRAWPVAECDIGVASSKESSPSTFEQGAICECVGVYHIAEQEGLEHALARQGPQRWCESRLIKDSFHRLREGCGIIGRKSKARSVDSFLQTSNGGGNHGVPEGHLFQRREARGLLHDRWNHNGSEGSKLALQGGSGKKPGDSDTVFQV